MIAVSAHSFGLITANYYLLGIMEQVPANSENTVVK